MTKQKRALYFITFYLIYLTIDNFLFFVLKFPGTFIVTIEFIIALLTSSI